MSEIHALSGAYAVDALDDIERAHFERHLRDCETCQDEVTSLREAAALLAETSAAAPSAELRERVLAGIATVRPLPPVVPILAPAAEVARRRWFPALVAAAAAVVAIGAGAVITQPWADDSSDSQISPAYQVLRAPDAQTYASSYSDKATVVRSLSKGQAVIVPKGMPPAPNGHRYALWLQHDNRMVPAGFMDSSGGPIILEGDAATATGAAISIEENGANPLTPSDQVVALFDFKA